MKELIRKTEDAPAEVWIIVRLLMDRLKNDALISREIYKSVNWLGRNVHPNVLADMVLQLRNELSKEQLK